MVKAPQTPKNKTLLKKTSGDVDLADFLMGKDLIGGLSSSESDSFLSFLKSKGVSKGKADRMDYKSVNSYYKRFRGSMK